MSTILKNVLRFTGLVVGVPQAQAHLLNTNQLPVAPRLVIPRLGGVVASADTTNVTVIRAVGGPADVDVYVEFWHSYENALPIGGLAGLTPFVLDSSGVAPFAPLGSNCLIFRPGSGAAGPVVFDSWAGIMTALAGLRAASNGSGCYTIQIDNSLVYPLSAVIPAGGPYDMTNVTIEGIDLAPQTAPTLNRVDIADGASFVQLRTLRGSLHIANLNNTNPADATLGATPGEIITASIGVIIENAGLAPFWRIVPGGFAALGTLIADVFASVGSVIDIPVAGSILALGGGAGSRIAGSAWSGVAGTFIQLGRQSSGVTFASVYPAFAGTIAVNSQGWTAGGILRPTPFGGPPITSPTTLEYASLNRCDVSGGAFTVTLPPLSANTTDMLFNPGSMIVVAEVSNNAGLSVQPSAGDTINGLVAVIAVNANGAVTLINDGFSDWRLLSSV